MWWCQNVPIEFQSFNISIRKLLHSDTINLINTKYKYIIYAYFFILKILYLKFKIKNGISRRSKFDRRDRVWRYLDIIDVYIIEWNILLVYCKLYNIFSNFPWLWSFYHMEITMDTMFIWMFSFIIKSNLSRTNQFKKH